MSRRASRIDANQSAIVEALRMAGARVWITSGAGGGFPDICVSYHGELNLLEIKDGAKPPSARKLTAAEHKFFTEFANPAWAHVVKSVDEALAAVGVKVH